MKTLSKEIHNKIHIPTETDEVGCFAKMTSETSVVLTNAIPKDMMRRWS